VRRSLAAVAAGKLMGLAIVFLVMVTVRGEAVQADAGAAATATVSAINTMWTLIAAFLVFGMQFGFVLLEAGFARSRETINVVSEVLVNTCICGLTFWAWGFGLMFGPGNGLIGTSGFMLHGLADTYGATGVPLLAFWLFQFAFADTCSTIATGAMVGRCRFVGDLLYTVGVTGFVYPIIGHWAWGPDGWLATMSPVPFRDFAGSTVVHSIGGAVSLAGAVVLGPRFGRVFARDGGGPALPHNVILGASGGLLLWFCWYGFNPGSTLSAMDAPGIARVAVNTTLAACAGGLASLFYSQARMGHWSLAMTTNGVLAGLVAITCPCYWVSGIGAVAIGAGGAVAMCAATDALEHFRVDDPVGAVPVHLAAGIWGTLSLGLFATGEHGVPTATGADVSATVTGLFYGGSVSQVAAQVIGSAAIVAATLVTSFALMYGLHLLGLLRAPEHGERVGLDRHEHGATAYPELDGSPAGPTVARPGEHKTAVTTVLPRARAAR
jgi:ammonium transporter, Amt family